MTVFREPQQITEEISQGVIEYLTGFTQRAAVAYLTQEQTQFDAVELNQFPIDVRPSAQSSFGDYSMPVMGVWSKKLKRAPLQIAEGMVARLKAQSSSIIAEITATKPGYINFRLDRTATGRDIITRVLEGGPDFGQSDAGIGTKIIVEHTNINSNKAAHVGHLRNACIGDTVVRMLRSQGYQVEADNYIDDSGVQVADVVVGFTLLQQGALQLAEGNEQLPDESFDYYCSRVYVGVGKVYEEKETELGQQALQLRKEVLHAIEQAGEQADVETDYAQVASTLSHRIVQAHLKTMARLNISYDLLPWESAILKAGLWKSTFAMLKERNLLEKPESGPAAGCWILPFGEGDAQTQEGDRSSDKILVRSDGTATYTAKDIAYQLWKFGLTDELGIDFHFVPWGVQHDGRKLWTMMTPQDSEAGTGEAPATRFGHARRVINVIDVRQSYLQQVVYESLRRLGYGEQAENSTHLAYEVVTLSAATASTLGVDTSDGRSQYAMSGRKGIEIKADDLIDAAARDIREKRQQEGKPEVSEETAAILATSAIRYFMIRFTLSQMITLDMDEVLRATGDTGVYLQYAYARANSIVRRLQEAGYEIPVQLGELPEQLEQKEWELLMHIDAYPHLLADATKELSPPKLAAYAYDLAAYFSDFYTNTQQILKETNPAIKAFRAQLVQASAQTMSNVLRVLGFDPQERL